MWSVLITKLAILAFLQFWKSFIFVLVVIATLTFATVQFDQIIL